MTTKQTVMLPRAGFTIVELLVVIVVIAILAAISLVTYTSIQRSAYDTAVQSDLRNFSNLARVQEAEEGPLVAANGAVMLQRLERLSWSASKAAYDTSAGRNLVGCFNYDTPASSAPWASNRNGRTNWALVARSKSGAVFYVSSEQPTPAKYTGSTPMVFDSTELVCGVVINQLGAAGFSSVAHGYHGSDTTTGPWRKWAGS